jgi:hypothetical protein
VRFLPDRRVFTRSRRDSLRRASGRSVALCDFPSAAVTWPRSAGERGRASVNSVLSVLDAIAHAWPTREHLAKIGVASVDDDYGGHHVGTPKDHTPEVGSGVGMMPVVEGNDCAVVASNQQQGEHAHAPVHSQMICRR